MATIKAGHNFYVIVNIGLNKSVLLHKIIEMNHTLNLWNKLNLLNLCNFNNRTQGKVTYTCLVILCIESSLTRVT